MDRVKIAITCIEPVIYGEVYPIFEDSPYLIIVDEYNRIQRYQPLLTASLKSEAKVDWLIKRGVKILITGSIKDEWFQVLTRAGVALDWRAFGSVKECVNWARRFSKEIQARIIYDPAYRCRLEKDKRPSLKKLSWSERYLNPPKIDYPPTADPRKAPRKGGRLLRPHSEDEDESWI